jgi:propanol-preferring alcohol dehydrogenase
MKAMVLRSFAAIERRPLEPRDIPAPAPGPGEILLRVRVCGVCHTDLHTVEGDLAGVPLPAIPGHQVVGIVEAGGEGAGRFEIGERAGAAWLFSACGACLFCLSGRENLCVDGRFTGFHARGGYAEYMVIPEAFAYEIPQGFADEAAAPLLCGGIIGYRALRLSGIERGGVLGIYGFGASAHIAIQIAVHRGCRVLVFTRTPDHQRLALSLGAAWAGSVDVAPPVKTEAAVIFAPAGALVPAALANSEKGGTVALAGIHMTSIPAMDYQKHLYHERVLRSVANATRRDGEELLSLAAEIPIATTTSIYPLEEANDVLRALKDGRINGAAVLRVS